MTLALHLLIVWYTTWVFVPSDTFLSPLWVVSANAALFMGLFHINTARKFGELH